MHYLKNSNRTPLRPESYLPPHLLRVAELTAEGMTDGEIATRLNLTPGTVKVYRFNVYRALKLEKNGNSRVRLARMVWEGKVCGAHLVWEKEKPL